MFERIGLVFRESSELFSRNLALIMTLLSITTFILLTTGLDLVGLVFTILTIYLIVDSFYIEDRLKTTLISLFKIFITAIITMSINAVIIGGPLLLAFYLGTGQLMVFIMIPVGIIAFFAFIIVNLWFSLTSFYIVDGFSPIDSLKYSYKAVREYSLYGLILGGGFIFAIVGGITQSIIAFSNAVLLVLFGAILGEIAALFIIFFLLLFVFLINYRIVAWSIKYFMSIYEDTNDVAL